MNPHSEGEVEEPHEPHTSSLGREKRNNPIHHHYENLPVIKK